MIAIKKKNLPEETNETLAFVISQFILIHVFLKEDILNCFSIQAAAGVEFRDIQV